jgi:hypothetical protein
MTRLGRGGWQNGNTREFVSTLVQLSLIDSTELLRELHAKYLISSRLLTLWLADHLLTANLAQVGFIAQLVATYSSDMARHVVNGRVCLRAACDKIQEVSRGISWQLTVASVIPLPRVAQEGRCSSMCLDRGESLLVV